MLLLIEIMLCSKLHFESKIFSYKISDFIGKDSGFKTKSFPIKLLNLSREQAAAHEAGADVSDASAGKSAACSTQTLLATFLH